MKIAAAKAALLMNALRATPPPAFAALRYDATKLSTLTDVKFEPVFSAIGRLKAIPEAMWFWTEAMRLRGTHT